MHRLALLVLRLPYSRALAHDFAAESAPRLKGHRSTGATSLDAPR
jgi:hypothetical protein